MTSRISLLVLTMVFAACSSTPEKKGPDWIRGPTRVVDNGYIVYVGISTAPNSDRAQFKAEGMALEDLANECSLIPKGARIEDRYSDREKYETTAYVKLALEFQECEEAKHAIDPQEIKKVASAGFTEELKKYQDLVETGDMPPPGQVAEIQPPAETAPPPTRQATWDDNTTFYMNRQYIAYQKEVVVLAPPAAYAPGTPQAQSFVSQVQPVSQQVESTAKANPAVMKSSWSGVSNRQGLSRPTALAPSGVHNNRSIQPPSTPRSQQHQGAPKKRQQRHERRRRGD